MPVALRDDRRPWPLREIRTIRDLVAGPPIRLDSRGVHKLKGVPGAWEVFAVVG